MKTHSRGFTLLELMVAVAVLAILLGWGVPTFRQFTRNNTVITAHNDLVTSLNLARSEALRRNRPVSVCASTDGTECGDETQWREGWVVFIDRETAGTIDDDDEILQAWQTSDTDLMFDAGGETFVQYLPTGMSQSPDPISISVSWEGCTGAQRLRRVTIGVTGSVTSENLTCGS